MGKDLLHVTHCPSRCLACPPAAPRRPTRWACCPACTCTRRRWWCRGGCTWADCACGCRYRDCRPWHCDWAAPGGGGGRRVRLRGPAADRAPMAAASLTLAQAAAMPETAAVRLLAHSPFHAAFPPPPPARRPPLAPHPRPRPGRPPGWRGGPWSCGWRGTAWRTRAGRRRSTGGAWRWCCSGASTPRTGLRCAGGRGEAGRSGCEEQSASIAET